MLWSDPHINCWLVYADYYKTLVSSWPGSPGLLFLQCYEVLAWFVCSQAMQHSTGQVQYCMCPLHAHLLTAQVLRLSSAVCFYTSYCTASTILNIKQEYKMASISPHNQIQSFSETLILKYLMFKSSKFFLFFAWIEMFGLYLYEMFCAFLSFEENIVL